MTAGRHNSRVLAHITLEWLRPAVSVSGSLLPPLSLMHSAYALASFSMIQLPFHHDAATAGYVEYFYLSTASVIPVNATTSISPTNEKGAKAGKKGHLKEAS